MKLSDYPKTIKQKQQYTAGDVAILYGVSHRTAAQMIDSGVLTGFTLPGSKQRRVLHDWILHHVASHPQYKFVLSRIEVPE